MRSIFLPRWPHFFFIFFAAFFALCVTKELWGQGRRLSLSDALGLVESQQVDVIVAKERVQQAIDRLTQARSVLFPQLTGTASLTRQTKNLEAFGIKIPGANPLVGPFNTFDARLGLTQEIFDAQAIARLRAARQARLISDAELEKTRQDVAALVATLYLEARRAKEQIASAQSLLKSAEEELKIVRAKKDVGSGSSLDVLEAESKAADARQTLASVQEQALERRLDLQSALGLPENETIAFVGDRGETGFRIPTDEELTASVEGHPAVQAAEHTVSERRAERSAEKADFFPRVTASADYGASGSSPSNSDGTYTFGGQLSVPIFKGGLRLGRIREASSKVRESQAQLDGARRETEAKARTARQTVLQARTLLKAAEAGDAEAMRRLELAKERLENGSGSSLEKIEAEAGEAVSHDAWLQAEATYRLSQINLEHAMGKMESLIGEGL